MDEAAWLKKNTRSLVGKTVALTGPTGGLGVPVCRMLLSCEASLILLSRGREKTMALIMELREQFPMSHIFWIPLDLSNMDSVKSACKELEQLEFDILIHNAGAYLLPEAAAEKGLSPVFLINFLSPYYMTKRLSPVLEQRRGKVIAVGSIASRYRHADPENPDFKGKKCSLVYGNSKRYLMYGLGELMKEHPQIRFVIAHPGLSFTAMSNHFSPAVYGLLKLPMKLIYMKPEQGARSIVRAVFARVPYLHWIGPRVCHIWGNPTVSSLKGCGKRERRMIFKRAESLCAGQYGKT